MEVCPIDIERGYPRGTIVFRIFPMVDIFKVDKAFHLQDGIILFTPLDGAG
jgi:hypothetical protein